MTELFEGARQFHTRTRPVRGKDTGEIIIGMDFLP